MTSDNPSTHQVLASSQTVGGVRLTWDNVPERVRAAVDARLGSPITSAYSQPGGFSPGAAARVRTEDGQRAFIKALGPEINPDSPVVHRREARVVAAFPPDVPAPRFLWSYDEGEGGWIVLAFEDIEGHIPALPWKDDELDLVIGALGKLATTLTPSPVPVEVVGCASQDSVFTTGYWKQLREEQPKGLDEWSARHLYALAEIEADAPSAVAGDTLLHLDIRADNILVTGDEVLFADWAHTRTGAAWVEMICFAPSVTMQGGPSPEILLSRYPAAMDADPRDITTVIVAVAGYFTRQSFQPAPPGLPTLREFQAAQGIVARQWVAERTGWE